MDIEQTIRDYLPSIIHLSLATSVNDQPWTTEVHFAYDDDLNLYFRSLSSRRHSQEIDRNPHVSGSIIRQHQIDEYPFGVYFEGKAEQMADENDRMQAFTAISKRFGLGREILDEAMQPSGHQFYRITVSKYYVFGKLDGDKGQKYELDWSTDHLS